MNGKVKFFNVTNKFGFINGEDGKQYFVHISGLSPGTRITENDDVVFDVVQGDRGPKAENVKKSGSSSSAGSAKPAKKEAKEDDDFEDSEEFSDDEEEEEAA
jgi:cold shock protein